MNECNGILYFFTVGEFLSLSMEAVSFLVMEDSLLIKEKDFPQSESFFFLCVCVCVCVTFKGKTQMNSLITSLSETRL